MVTQTLTPHMAQRPGVSLLVATRRSCAARRSPGDATTAVLWSGQHNFTPSGAPAPDQESPPTG